MIKVLALSILLWLILPAPAVPSCKELHSNFGKEPLGVFEVIELPRLYSIGNVSCPHRGSPDIVAKDVFGTNLHKAVYRFP